MSEQNEDNDYYPATDELTRQYLEYYGPLIQSVGIGIMTLGLILIFSDLPGGLPSNQEEFNQSLKELSNFATLVELPNAKFAVALLGFGATFAAAGSIQVHQLLESAKNILYMNRRRDRE